MIMKNILMLILFLLSVNISAEELTENSYRKVYAGLDYENHQYLIISDDSKTLIYSTEKLYARHNAVPSIILNDTDFKNLLEQFTLDYRSFL